jgi:hypothetical protein
MIELHFFEHGRDVDEPAAKLIAHPGGIEATGDLSLIDFTAEVLDLSQGRRLTLADDPIAWASAMPAFYQRPGRTSVRLCTCEIAEAA